MKTFSFIKNQRIFFGIVAVVFVIGIASFFINGFNVDIDFVGGTEITYDLGKPVTKDDEANIEAAVIEAIGADNFSSIRVAGDHIIVRTLVIDNKNNTAEISQLIKDKIAELHPEAVYNTESTDTSLHFELPEQEEGETAWTEEALDAVRAALASIGADGLTVDSHDAELHVEFNSSSPVAKLRSDITEAITKLYDITNDISAGIDAKVNELFAGAVLTDGSTATSKTYTMETADTDEEGNAVLYTWTEDDATALEAALVELGYQDVSVNTNLTSLYISFPETSSVEWLSTDSVSAEISAGLRNSAITATGIAVILMLVYIAFRFQISSAFAAIVCLTHDLFVMLAAYSLLQIPVNSTIIAALLTILGYSINATIIIFDRIRENDKKFSDFKGFGEKVDNGIRNTIWRSINTTLTTLFTIGMIYFLGVTSIKNFALPLIVGIIAGLFSSVCLAGPLWRIFKKLGKKIRNK